MAKRTKQRRDFLQKHPFCIYCGGEIPATERDHVPSRQFFHSRQWPEGYEFPSCWRCNRVTKDAEQVMALLAHISLKPKTKAQMQEFARISRAIRNNYPGVLQEMMSAGPEKVAEYRAKPWFLPLAKAGLAAPEPIALNGPLMKDNARTFARKLFASLYYKEFKKIIPAAGGIMWRWYSNVHWFDGVLPDEFLQMMQGQPTIQRTRRDLTDQFFYVFEKAVDGDIAAFFAAFRDSFAMLGFVETDVHNFELVVPGAEILRPLKPPVTRDSAAR